MLHATQRHATTQRPAPPHVGTCNCFEDFSSSDGAGGAGSRGDCGYIDANTVTLDSAKHCPREDMCVVVGWRLGVVGRWGCVALGWVGSRACVWVGGEVETEAWKIVCVCARACV